MFGKEKKYSAFNFMATVADQTCLIALVCVWALDGYFVYRF